MAFNKLSLDVFLLIAEELCDFDLSALSRTSKQIHETSNHVLYTRDAQRHLVVSAQWAFHWDNRHTLERVIKARIGYQGGSGEHRREIIASLLAPLVPSGWTILTLAVREGLLNIILLLIDYEFDVNEKTITGSTALCLAVSQNKEKIARALLDSGQRHADLAQILPLAARKSQWVVVETLIRQGLDVRQDTGRAILGLAISQNDETRTQSLIELGMNIDLKSKDRATTPMIQAAAAGNAGIVELLIRKGAYIDHQDSFGMTALHFAALKGHELVVDTLLNNGAIASFRNRLGETPLLMAASSGHVRIAYMLLTAPGVEVDAYGADGRTSLLSAVARGRFATVDALISYGADVLHRDKHGDTPLLLAAKQGSIPILQRLLEVGEAGLELQDRDGRTPLLAAVAQGSERAVDILLNSGADRTSRDKYGDTPLLLASGQGHYRVVCHLLEIGDVGMECRDKNGRTPLLRAAYMSQADVVCLLLAANAIPTQIDGFGNTAMSFTTSHTPLQNIRDLLLQMTDTPGVFLRQSAKSGDLTTMEYLLSVGVPADDQDLDGRTALSWAASQNQEGAIELLLSTGAVNVNSRDRNGHTPLFWAAMKNNGRIIRALVASGADRILEDDFGRTPRWWQRALNLRPARGLPRMSRVRKRGIRTRLMPKNTPLQ